MTAAAVPPLPGRLAVDTRGAGERVVCLHSSTGSNAQWRALHDALGGRREVVAPDLHGHGRSPAWPDAVPATLAVDGDAVAALSGIAAGNAVHLVGHSYGAAVALHIALQWPQQVRSLTLYEPVAFGLLHSLAAGAAAAAVDAVAATADAAGGGGATAAALDEIEAAASSVAARVGAGQLQTAAQVFVDYWAGAGSWFAMAADQQRVVLGRMPAVPRHFEALFALRWSAARLRHALRMPLLLLQGGATRASAARVSELLAGAVPAARHLVLPGAGHLGPLTHAAVVARLMADHLQAPPAPQPGV